MNSSLPDTLKSFVDEQVSRRGHGTSSEYVRELIRKDRTGCNFADCCSQARCQHPVRRPMRRTSTGCVTAFARMPGLAPGGEGQACYPARAGQPGHRRGDPYYLDEDAEPAALGFIDALEQAYAHINRHPGARSLRHAHELNRPGLRSWPMTRYPYLVFYVERSDYIDVWRVLHDQRDIPAWMQEPDDAPLRRSQATSHATGSAPASPARA